MKSLRSWRQTWKFWTGIWNYKWRLYVIKSIPSFQKKHQAKKRRLNQFEKIFLFTCAKSGNWKICDEITAPLKCNQDNWAASSISLQIWKFWLENFEVYLENFILCNTVACKVYFIFVKYLDLFLKYVGKEKIDLNLNALPTRIFNICTMLVQ